MLRLFRAGLTSPLSAVVPRAPAPRADFVFVLRRESALGRAGLVRWHQPGSGGGSGTTGRLGRGEQRDHGEARAGDHGEACVRKSIRSCDPAPRAAGSWVVVLQRPVRPPVCTAGGREGDRGKARGEREVTCAAEPEDDQGPAQSSPRAPDDALRGPAAGAGPFTRKLTSRGARSWSRRGAHCRPGHCACPRLRGAGRYTTWVRDSRTCPRQRGRKTGE